VVVVAVV